MGIQRVSKGVLDSVYKDSGEKGVEPEFHRYGVFHKGGGTAVSISGGKVSLRARLMGLLDRKGRLSMVFLCARTFRLWKYSHERESTSVNKRIWCSGYERELKFESWELAVGQKAA